MTQTLTPQKILLTLAILFLISYGVFNSRFLIKGPEIAIAGLEKDSEIIKTDSKDFALSGKVLHSSFITVNNRPILVDESGNFNEKLLLSNGVSIIDMYARDKFGKEVRKKIDVVYTGESSSTTPSYEDIALLIESATSTKENEETQEELGNETSTSSSSF